MRWWCSAIVEDWSWTPRPYLGVWILCGALVAGYVVATRRHRSLPVDPAADATTSGGTASDGAASDTARRDRRRPWQFALGIFFLWAASDWPVGTLGASYLSSIHMLQYMLYTLAAAPMLMLATPEWMGRRIIEKLHLEGVHRIVARPLVAAIISNVILISTHSPIAVDALRATQFGSFALDMIWLVSGFILWTPIISPLPEARAHSAGVKILYLFAAAALMPMIPGGFLTFSSQPLYSTYELAPRLAGINALNDQQVAGVLMKVGNLPLIWTVIAVIWFRWYRDEQRSSRVIHRDPVTGAPLRAPVDRSSV
ncbi:MAG: cytochrome c oxidase assembly protein [Microthrixaceae bacterium]|nr:cytochrome c oxidase assembly protein [Microthrixaceae bacterium]MCO5304717.1 cytochrome c oxidase assembly protein [Microthrixaceae bacterium]